MKKSERTLCMTNDKETCHQDAIAVHHWLCSECGHGEPWCYASHDDYLAGRRFERCPGCGRVIDWDYWKSHLYPGETRTDRTIKEIMSELDIWDEEVEFDDGLPPLRRLDVVKAFNVSIEARKMLNDGIEQDEVKRRLREKYDGGDSHA